MAKNQPVRRPTKRSEWTIVHADRQSEKGWADLIATQRNSCADLYDRLQTDPTAVQNPAKQHQLKGSLSTVNVAGQTLPQWQYELANGARIWYGVDGPARTVYLTLASPHHPNATK